jgi:hypothetical protein
MEHFRHHPEDFTTWEAVKERALVGVQGGQGCPRCGFAPDFR